jgi:hypothetical protein
VAPPVYRFATTWRLPAEPERVYAVLADIERYDRWWPQVRRITRLDDESGDVQIRSVLPWTLHLHLRRELEDESALRLRAAVRGHLDGWSSWELSPGPGGTHAAYRQEVELHAPLLRRVSFLLRPVLRANHAAMMRGGERGLRAHLTR